MELTYTNPVWDRYFADPFVLKTGGRYYAYGTGGKRREPDGRAFPLLTSEDLVRWEYLGGALTALGDPAASSYWAPEVAERDGRFYMYYSAGGGAGEAHRLRVAESDTPEGPFTDTGRILLPDEPFSIDASPFCDPRDGRWYLYFAKDYLDIGRVGTGTAVVPLADDMATPAGPVKTVVRASADWQIFQRNRTWYGKTWAAWHTVEGPHVVYHEGRYYCFYSGGRWESEGYGVGFAVADDPMGPWVDDWSAQGPVVLRGVEGKVLGPGHTRRPRPRRPHALYRLPRLGPRGHRPPDVHRSPRLDLRRSPLRRPHVHAPGYQRAVSGSVYGGISSAARATDNRGMETRPMETSSTTSLPAVPAENHPVLEDVDFLIDTLVAGQLSENTRRAYQRDVIDFLEFVGVDSPQGLREVTAGQVERFRNTLMKNGAAKATVNRKLSVVRQLFERAIGEGWADRNPARRVRGLRANQESPTSGLTLRQARELLASIDTSDLLGQRDHCLLFLMLRTGLRRSEAAGIRLGDFAHKQGHETITVLGKGDKVRVVKIAPDVLRCCRAWVEASGREWTQKQHAEPLFVPLRRTKTGHSIASHTPLSVYAIWHTVLKRVDEAGLAAHITPHSLRHTFVTLALEGGAPLHKVQYAAGHADPRTTERYHRQKENLDDNAVDYVRL